MLGEDAADILRLLSEDLIRFQVRSLVVASCANMFGVRGSLPSSNACLGDPVYQMWTRSCRWINVDGDTLELA